MQTHTLAWRAYEIVVQPEQNEFGAWRATVSVRMASDATIEHTHDGTQT
jgi:hypothetical protein